MKPIFTSPYRYIFILGLLVFITASVFSSGYYHPDEHFQILEFCNYKLGNSSASDLPWEFNEKMRPALQPSIGIVIIKFLNFIGINNPFTYSFALRLMSALFSWFIISSICLQLLNQFSSKSGKKWFLILSFFLWFVPFLNVRFSSENFSALTFLSAVYFIIRFKNDEAGNNLLYLAFAGLLLGFSFFFRFQMGFAILGLGLWIILIEKIHWKNVLILTLSGFLSASFCVGIDYWFYGEFVITPVNYFMVNIVEDNAPSWGTQAWWYYLVFFILKAVPPISIILLLLFFIGLFKSPKSLFAWILVFFLLGHYMIGHKELRFLFPVAFCFIYVVAVGMEFIALRYQINKVFKAIVGFSIILNLIMLAFVIFTPAKSVIGFYKYLYSISLDREVILLCKEESAYELVGLNVNFYRSKNINCLNFKNESEILDYLKVSNQQSVLLLERNFLNEANYPGYSYKTVYGSLPPWIIHFNYNNWIERSHVWKILELEKIAVANSTESSIHKSSLTP